MQYTWHMIELKILKYFLWKDCWLLNLRTQICFFDLVVPYVHVYTDESQSVRGYMNTPTILVWSGLINEDHCPELWLEPRLSQLTHVFLFRQEEEALRFIFLSWHFASWCFHFSVDLLRWMLK